jgi:hypothetical protein
MQLFRDDARHRKPEGVSEVQGARRPGPAASDQHSQDQAWRRSSPRALAVTSGLLLFTGRRTAWEPEAKTARSRSSRTKSVMLVCPYSWRKSGELGEYFIKLPPSDLPRHGSTFSTRRRPTSASHRLDSPGTRHRQPPGRGRHRLSCPWQSSKPACR